MRGMATGYRFAFWDTVVDRFVTIGDDQAWDTVEDLHEGAMIASIDTSRYIRYISLCPAWSYIEEKEDA